MKNILLCVTGGIAVFKAASLTSKLTQNGFQVRVMMSQSAEQFVTPLTFQVLSKHPVYDDTFDEKDPSVIAHIDLADWPDAIVIAPATANIIGKLANGIADDMISTTLLATTKPVFIAPAMNVHMYEHPAVKKNMQTLKAFGYHFIEPNSGHLACGYNGAGRLKEPEEIVAELKQYFDALEHKPLQGKKVLITAGPTQEKIDPVRYFTNHSSGKMGYELAEIARHLGAIVTLVTGPTHLTPPKGVDVVRITSAADMYDVVMTRYPEQDVVIKAAAVADYRPVVQFDQKVKKQPGDWSIDMERTFDILKTLGENKTNQILVGFAAESENVEANAQKKLQTKNADFIVANNITQVGAGFKSDTNQVVIYRKDGTKHDLPLLSKKEVAEEILAEVVAEMERRFIQ
ncbi:bifunctional phosphopantothenoylcysteine decarboxylase/phosphopantothenate--cysteine ligase CoaBC [Massilibacterium senegalense]|uniref:bifunctional phosphopantothenoylcysteine decarboxylase/phosphopantothenate--cysteine ligase CoaBC n=1 Tax=Massilibacterium senegalense TaxID=1632858 RepID=UPI0007824BC7|nr:bifunctional phosphopantothenoylcysteine decarboxylase/phosphopantothenate--cysteine ligase CoaBC [Massilibacterium senegalense]